MFWYEQVKFEIDMYIYIYVYNKCVHGDGSSLVLRCICSKNGKGFHQQQYIEGMRWTMSWGKSLWIFDDYTLDKLGGNGWNTSISFPKSVATASSSYREGVSVTLLFQGEKWACVVTWSKYQNNIHFQRFRIPHCYYRCTMRCLSQPPFSIYVYRKNIPKGPTWVVQYQLLAVKHFIPFICEASSIVKSLFKTSLDVILCNPKGRSSVPSYINSSLPSWRFRSTHLKNLLVKIGSFPQVSRGKKTNKYLKNHHL